MGARDILTISLEIEYEINKSIETAGNITKR